MKGIIIYQGKYGATVQYARWLADVLGYPLLPAERATTTLLANYDVVIAGSSVYVGKLLIAKWLDRHAGDLAEKEVWLFVVCGTTADDPDQQAQLISNNLGRALQRTLPVFFLPGRCVISKLSWKDRIVLKIGAWLQKDPQQKAVMNQGFDRLDRKKLEPLVAAVRSALKDDAP